MYATMTSLILPLNQMMLIIFQRKWVNSKPPKEPKGFQQPTLWRKFYATKKPTIIVI